MKYSRGLFLCLVLLVLACKKEINEPSANQGSVLSDTLDCPPYELPNESLSVLHSWSNYNKMMPCFNPNNNDEFLYIDKIPGSPFSDMCIHNLVTGETNCILSGQTYLSQPRWHANDWILFRGNGDNIFRIKSNGDSLLQITTSSVFQRPVWRPDGLAWIANNVVEFTGNIEVYNLSGEIIDVIPGEVFHYGDWSVDNRIVTHRPNNFDPHQIAWTEVENVSWQLLNFDTASPQPSLRDLHWIPMSDEVMISQLYEDISRINVFTGEKIRVTDRCIGTYYEYFSINNSCSKIVAQLISPEQIYSDGWFNIIIQKSEIVIMNFDGSGQQVINLP
jgi:hypothetical protein